MQNLLTLIQWLQDPMFVLFVVFPPLVLLSVWPALMQKVHEKSERINRRVS